MTKGQIIAIGGGGFSEGSEPGLDAYVLGQSAANVPKVGFIGTASGDAERYLLKFYSRFSQLNCTPSHLTFFRRTPNLTDWIMAQDVIFVGGGNTFSLLAVWQAWEIAPLLKESAAQGTVLSGISAGANCWFESCLTDAKFDEFGPLQCLNFLSGSCCPHYSSEIARQQTFEHLIDTETLPPGIAIDDGAAAHFIDGRLTRIISGTEGATAYSVVPTPTGVTSKLFDGIEIVNLAR